MTPGVNSAHPPRRRLQLVMLIGLVFWALLIARLAKVQLLDHESYLRYADREHWGRVELPPERGAILDRHHRLLAHNVLSHSLVVRTRAMPALVESGPRRRHGGGSPGTSALPPWRSAELRGHPADSLIAVAAASLAPRLHQGSGQLEALMRRKPYFLYLERQMEADRESVWVHSGPLPAGVSLEAETKRIRPLGALAREIVGSTDIDGQPLGGIEKRFDDMLRGSPGWVTTFRDGRWIEHRIPERGMRPPVPGTTLELSLDASFQAVVEERLHAAILEHHARGGSVVLVDPNTGEVLALANETHAEGQADVDRAVTDMMEPGSTFKMVVYAAALEHGLITRDTPINCEGGTWYLGQGKPIHDDKHDHFGVVPAWYALMKSSNIGAGKVGLKLGPDQMVDFAHRLGFGAPSGVDLPGEAPGYLATPGPNQQRQLATICFGQGVSVSMMQLAMAYCAIANGGTLLRPHILHALYDTQGHLVRTFRPEPVRRAMSERTAAQMRAMLQAVVDSGTASAARMSWVSVGGKTGTAQKAAANRGGYGQGKYMSLFVGFLPVDKPQLVMVTMIDEPQGQHYGGLVAAPVFRDVMEAIARSGNGPVSPPFEVVTPSGKAAAPGPGQEVLPDLRGQSRRAAVAALADLGHPVNLVGHGMRVLRMQPEPETFVAPRTCVTLWTDANAGAATDGPSVPPVVGLSIREALGRLRDLALTARVVGGGRVTRQQPEPGTPARAGQVVTLYADAVARN